jgi:hypothetical protein
MGVNGRNFAIAFVIIESTWFHYEVKSYLTIMTNMPSVEAAIREARIRAESKNKGCRVSADCSCIELT